MPQMIVLAPRSPPCCDALVAIPLAEMLSSHGTKAKEGASAWTSGNWSVSSLKV